MALARSALSVSSMGPMRESTPALLIRLALSNAAPSNVASHASRRAATGAGSARSPAHCSSDPPRAASASFVRRAMPSTVWPGAASCCASAAPRPRDEPVTT